MLNTNLPQKTETKLDWNLWYWIVYQVRKLVNTKFDPTKFVVRDESNGRFVTLKPSPIEVSIPEDFGIKAVSGTNITIYGGDLIIGISKVTTPDTTLNITTTGNIGWQYTYSNSAFTIQNFGTTFVTDDAYIRKNLYLVATTNSVPPGIQITRIKHESQNFPANFSA